MGDINVRVEKGQILVEPETYAVGKGRNKKITWEVLTPEWTFPDDGIVFEQPDGQFADLSKDSGGRKYKATARNTNAQRYKYMVRLVGRDGGAIERDPFIQNGDDPPP